MHFHGGNSANIVCPLSIKGSTLKGKNLLATEIKWVYFKTKLLLSLGVNSFLLE